MYKIILKNYFNTKEETEKMIEDYYKYILKKNPTIIFQNNYLQIYYNTKYTNSNLFINKQILNSIFIAGCKNNYLHNKIYYFITNNSWNPKLSFSKKITDTELYKFQTIFPYKESYYINKEGFIYIIINNTYGWFMNNCNVKYVVQNHNYKKMLINLIKNIRKYTNRKIVIRTHPKDRNNGNNYIEIRINEILNELNDTNISINNIIKSEDIVKNAYCVFIQNSKFILDFVNNGIPIYNLDFFNCNYFSEIQIKNLAIINNLEENISTLPNRIEFLKRFYYHVIIEEKNLLYFAVKKLYLS